MKITFIGLYACGNIGDEAIWCANSDYLLSKISNEDSLHILTYGFGGVEWRQVPTNKLERDQLFHYLAIQNLHKARTFNFRKFLFKDFWLLLKAIYQSNKLFYVGGHWLHDLSLITFIAITIPIFLSRIFNNTAGFINIGVGPLKRNFSKLILIALEKISAKFSVRDPESAKTLLPVNSIITSDSAYLLELNTEKNSNTIIPKNYIGICPCAWFKFENIYTNTNEMKIILRNSFIEIISKINEMKYKPIFIPTMLPEDLDFCNLVNEELKNRNIAIIEIVSTEKYTARELFSNFSNLQLLISFRMHPSLFAIRNNIPLIALNYAAKLESLLKNLNYSDSLINLDNNWQINTINKIESAINSHKEAAAININIQTEKAKSGLDIILS